MQKEFFWQAYLDKKTLLFEAHDLGKINLFHNDEGFHIVQNDEVYSVSNHFVDPLIRTQKHKQLKKFQLYSSKKE